MPVPKPGTVHHALGHGRVPTSGVVYGGAGYTVSGVRSASAVGHDGLGTSVNSRFASSYTANAVARKASRARRESFKPRPSVDACDGPLTGGGMRWNGFAASVKEEEEDY